MRSTRDKVLLGIGLGGSILAPLVAMLASATPEAFVHFGMEMPAMVQAALSLRHGFWLLPLLVLLAWWFWPQPPRRAQVACLVGVVGAVIGLTLAFAAWWWPMFKLRSLLG